MFFSKVYLKNSNFFPCIYKNNKFSNIYELFILIDDFFPYIFYQNNKGKGLKKKKQIKNQKNKTKKREKKKGRKKKSTKENI